MGPGRCKPGLAPLVTYTFVVSVSVETGFHSFQWVRQRAVGDLKIQKVVKRSVFQHQNYDVFNSVFAHEKIVGFYKWVNLSDFSELQIYIEVSLILL